MPSPSGTVSSPFLMKNAKYSSFSADESRPGKQCDNANALVAVLPTTTNNSSKKKSSSMHVFTGSELSRSTSSSSSFSSSSITSFLSSGAFFIIALITLLLMASSFADAAVTGTGPNCSDLPTITLPVDELFVFGPIASTQTATFDFFLATHMTNPQGMQSGYASKITTGNTMALTENMWWSGTLGYHDKLIAYEPGERTILCEWPVRRLFKDTRRGVLKRDLFPTTIDVAFHPTHVSPNTAFDFTLHGTDTEDYANLFDTKGYRLAVMFSTHRKCTTLSLSIGDEATATRVNSSALRWPVGTSLNEGVYSVCLRITNAAGDTSGWFPLSAANGHYNHNIFVSASGVPAPFSGFSTISSNAISYGSPALMFIDSTVQSGDYTEFMLDSTLDMCSPLLGKKFDDTNLAFWNGTDEIVSIQTETPASLPGGGIVHICASTAVNAPWFQITLTPLLILQCTTSGQYWTGSACGTCNCNNAGDCNTNVTIDYTVASLVCSCNSGFYGTNCQFADLPPPNSSFPHLSVFRLRTVVEFHAPNPDWDVVLYWENGTEISQKSPNFAYLPPRPRNSAPLNYTVTLSSRSSNGSETSAGRRPTFIFTMNPPTLTLSKSHSMTETSTNSSSASLSVSDSHTDNETASVSLSESNTSTQSQTITPPPTGTKTFTKTQTLPPTPTKTASKSRSRLPMDPVVCAAALEDNPAIFRFPATEVSLTLLDSYRCGDCGNLTCSFGFAGACTGADEIMTNISFLSLFPSPHCNVSFYNSVTGSFVPIKWPFELLPTVPIASNFWIPAEGATARANDGSNSVIRPKNTLAVALINYTIAPVPFPSNNITIQARLCSGENATADMDDWVQLDVATESSLADSLAQIELEDGDTPQDSYCLDILIEGSPLNTSIFRVDVETLSTEGAIASGFIHGSVAFRLRQVSDGSYLPAVRVDDPEREQVQTSSAFAPGQVASQTSLSSSGALDSISDLNNATISVIAGSLLGGALLAYLIYYKLRPKQQDNIASIANAMMQSPDELR